MCYVAVSDIYFGLYAVPQGSYQPTGQHKSGAAPDAAANGSAPPAETGTGDSAADSSAHRQNKQQQEQEVEEEEVDVKRATAAYDADKFDAYSKQV